MFETILIIAEQALIDFPLILGAYITISLMKLPDLSIESAYVFGALVASSAMPLLTTLPSPLMLITLICVSMVAGACVGLTSGLLTQKARIPHLLSAIITIGLFHGISQAIAGVYVSLGRYQNALTLDVIPLHPELPVLAIVFTVCVLAALYFFTTELGYSLAVYGNNPSFFTQYGISTSYVYILGIIIANGFAGLSGYLSAQSNGFADLSMGFGKILLCVTALILGKIITTKNLSIIPSTCGLFMYMALQQLLLKVGFDLRYFSTVQALVVVVILIMHHTKKENSHSDHLGV